MIRILIADDHPLVLEGLKRIIAQGTDMIIGGEAHSGQEVLDKLDAESWDVIMLDISMPGKDGFEVLRQLHSRQPRLPVLVLTVHSEGQLATRALQMGAAGYLTKECAPKDLLDAIRMVHSGRKYITSSIAENLADMQAVDAAGQPHKLLTDREFQIFCLITEGKSVHQIAETLSISVKTVRTHRSRILEKMNLKGDVELTRYAYEHKLV